MSQPETIVADVLIVGAGPAGLAAGVRLRQLGVEKVLVIDREAQAGGIPRHCYHTGFGWFDMRRILSGPAYARRNVQKAEQSGVEIATETTARHWTGNLTLQAVNPTGLKNIGASAILLATGCRERPRAAKLIPGSRPHGIYNTGSLQQLTYFKKLKPGNRAIVIGAEHVSYSAIHTLRSSGIQVAAMITAHSQHQTYLPIFWGTRFCYRTPLITNHEVTNIHGTDRLEAIEITSTINGEKKLLQCDTLIFTGDWIPDHDLARKGNITINNHTNGPEIDQNLRTSQQGIFAAGNVLHGVETADTAALEGKHVAESIVRYLSTKRWPTSNRMPIIVDPPLQWISPNTIVPNNDTVLPLNRFTFRTGKFLIKPTIEIKQGEKLLHSQTFRKLIPNRWFHLENRWVSKLDLNCDSRNIRILVKCLKLERTKV